MIATAPVATASFADLLESLYRFLTDKGCDVRDGYEEQAYPPLDHLVELFQLTSFERSLLLFCAAIQLDHRFTTLLAEASPFHNTGTDSPTFSYALATLPNPHWTALSTDRPLRHWHLLESTQPDISLHSPLLIDPRILLYLLEVPSTDEHLLSFIRIRKASTGSTLSSSSLDLGARYWLQSCPGLQSLPLLLIAGDPNIRSAMADAVARQAGYRLAILRAADIPTDPQDRELLARRWCRESMLTASALFLQAPDADRLDEQQSLNAFLALLTVPVALGLSPDAEASIAGGLRLHQTPSSRAERLLLWHEQLGPFATGINDRLEALVDQFDLPPAQVHFTATLARIAAETSDDPAHLSSDYLWQLARDYARQPLYRLAHRIEPRAHWQDLVLPPAQKEILQQIILNVRHRSQVYDRWEFDAGCVRGLAVTALFSGDSGTGKTMAAEVIANALHLDLFQVDLASLVSKYIGETEKNLSRVFDAAEQSGAVLLFDEADALFGKRTEVNDSHDRYANLEVSYLLQRMESYRGVAILTTNMKQAFDPAFTRRIRFFVNFPYPDAACRSAIWQAVFPRAASLGSLNYDHLAQLNIPGGLIRNIALQSAFVAAQAGQPISMSHILTAARAEYGKADRAIPTAELRGWS